MKCVSQRHCCSTTAHCVTQTWDKFLSLWISNLRDQIWDSKSNLRLQNFLNWMPVGNSHKKAWKTKHNIIFFSPQQQLSTYGVKQEQTTFPRVTMASHRWVCCRHSSKKKKKDNCITAVNLTRKTPRQLTWPCIADSAMMNPRKPWLALKGRSILILILNRNTNCNNNWNSSVYDLHWGVLKFGLGTCCWKFEVSAIFISLSNQNRKGSLVISMKISPSRVEKYFIFSTFLDGT